MVDSTTQTKFYDVVSSWPVITLNSDEMKATANAVGKDIQPGVPCHILSSIVSTLNTQISWLLVSKI